ncbi:heterokaryon incompatibility protein-domain-containing protein [Nemania diffusa]|nr:heterokaryon incompatibility protein-domain-containing protein [Nemania diffusa]
MYGMEYIYIGFGGTLPGGTISCDGHDMPVGGELLRALQCLRDDKEPLRIWIDALCINQQDIVERNKHVKMMASIYQNVLRVRVWVGDVVGLEPPLFKVLDDLDEIVIDLKEKLESSKSIEDGHRCCMSHPKWYSVDWYTLAQFLDRAWFERVWVVQEVANAKEVVFQTGQHCRIAWGALCNHIINLAKCRLTEQISHPSALANLVTIIDIRQHVQAGRKGSEASIPSLLSKMRNFKSTLPSDKIYGVLSILNSNISIDVDYAQPSETLFTNLAIRHLQSGNLDLLDYCGEPHHPTTLELPSWVPDWTQPKWTSPFSERGLKYSAAGSTKAHFSIDASSKTLRVKGRLLDAVAIVNNAAEIPIVQYEPYDRLGMDGELDAHARTKMMYKRAQRKLRDVDENMVLLAWPWPRDFSWKKYENMWRTYMCNRLPDNEVPSDIYGLGWEDHMEWKFEHTTNEEDTDDTGPYHKLIMKIFLDHEGVRQRRAFKQLFSGLWSNGVTRAHRSWCYNRRFFYFRGREIRLGCRRDTSWRQGCDHQRLQLPVSSSRGC